MWIPDLRLQPSPAFILVLSVLHVLTAIAVWMLPDVFLLLFPALLVSCLVTVSKHGLLLLKTSVVRVWLSEKGWYLECRDQRLVGPLMLSPATHLGSYTVRLSFSAGRQRRHILITPHMIGREAFRKLQVFLRWSANKQVAPLAPG